MLVIKSGRGVSTQPLAVLAPHLACIRGASHNNYGKIRVIWLPILWGDILATDMNSWTGKSLTRPPQSTQRQFEGARLICSKDDVKVSEIFAFSFDEL